MALTFRNLTVTPDDPVEEWGLEGVLAALDRGDLRDWSKVRTAASNDPWGPVARDMLLAADLAEDRGAAAWARAALRLVREEAEAAERATVAADLRALLDASGFSTAEFAERLGTSRSRLSTYLNAKVCPSAALMVRARRIAATAPHKTY